MLGGQRGGFEQDTNPDSFGSFFSGSSNPGGFHQNAQGVLVPGDDTSTFTLPGSDGFGPGDYSGGYTGRGDRVYWGPYDDVSSPSSFTPSMGPVHVGPGGMIQSAVSSTGDTILLPPSQTTSVVAPPSSTGDTVLGPAESAVVQPASTIGATGNSRYCETKLACRKVSAWVQVATRMRHIMQKLKSNIIRCWTQRMRPCMRFRRRVRVLFPPPS